MKQNCCSTKQQIINVALALFAEKGIEHCSMNDIICATGLSKGGVYHHFSSKDQLVLEACGEFFAQCQARFRSTLELPGSVRDRTINVMKDFYSTSCYGEIRVHSLFIRIFLHCFSDEQLKVMACRSYNESRDVLMELIRQGVDAGELRPEVDVELAATGMIALFDGYGMQVALNDLQSDALDWKIRMLDQYMSGLRPG